MTQTVYQIGPTGLYTGQTQVIGDFAPMRPGWTLAEPPSVGEGQVAVWAWSGWVVAPAPNTAPAGLSPAGPAVPDSVELWQARAICAMTPYGDGTLEQAIEAAIASLPAETQAAASAFWGYGSQIGRTSPTLQALADGLGLTSAEVDNLFIQAAALPPP